MHRVVSNLEVWAWHGSCPLSAPHHVSQGMCSPCVLKSKKWSKLWDKVLLMAFTNLAWNTAVSDLDSLFSDAMNKSTEWFGFKDHLIYPCCHGQGHLPPDLSCFSARTEQIFLHYLWGHGTWRCEGMSRSSFYTTSSHCGRAEGRDSHFWKKVGMVCMRDKAWAHGGSVQHWFSLSTAWWTYLM